MLSATPKKLPFPWYLLIGNQQGACDNQGNQFSQCLPNSTIVATAAFGDPAKGPFDMVGTWCGPMDTVYATYDGTGSITGGAYEFTSWSRLTITEQDNTGQAGSLFYGYVNQTDPNTFFSGVLYGPKAYMSFIDAVGVGDYFFWDNKGSLGFKLFITKQGKVPGSSPETSVWTLLKETSGFTCP